MCKKMRVCLIPGKENRYTAYLCCMDYFQLFGLPVAPAVDRSLLAKKYFELQRQNHPDFFTQHSEHEQEEALALTADINKAFAIFKNEQKTIEYFLQHEGIIQENEKYNLPADFLMEMMDINEAVSAEDEAAVSKEVADYTSKLYEGIKPILENYPTGEIKPETLQELKAYYYKKKYLNRILDRLGG